MDWNVFCENIKEILELEKYKNANFLDWNINDKKIVIKYHCDENKVVEFSYTKIKFNKDYRNIDNNELSVINDVYYEVPISMKNEYFSLALRETIVGNKYSDSENNLEYMIERPSVQFLFKMIYLKIKPNAIMMMRRLQIRDRELKFEDGIEKKDIFDLLKMIYKDCITLRVTSIDKKKKSDFQDLVDSFIFNINYNTDIGIRQTYNLETVQDRRRANRFRNEAINEIDPPKRIYKKELIEQYNMASISEDPFIKYLCYYHILEHFYESVYNEEIVKIVKEYLTSPSFSIKKQKEILKLIDAIKDKLKCNRENFEGNELKALELVIKKFINLNTLKNNICNINTELVEYYDKQKVPFSQGIPVNFNDTDNLYKNLAKRIYITRNSLVHYKSNDLTLKEKRIYRPFDDRKDLLKEVPLIRILAEEVIIKDSKIL